jgi:NADH-quinone oxidoreductase subunit L
LLLSLVILFAYRTYVKRENIPSADGEPQSFFRRLVTNKFYIDEIYTATFEKPFGFLSDFFFKKVENGIIDPAVEGIGSTTQRIGTMVRKLQQGNISFYLFAMVAGILLFIVFILLI